VLYLATPSGPDVCAAMSDPTTYLGAMTTPAQGNCIPDVCRIGADNGKFGDGWPGYDAWFAWLGDTIAAYGADRFVFAVAPDVPFDPDATLAESRPWLPRIRRLDVPAAYVAQNGATPDGMPWGEFDVLFIGGGKECLPCGYVRPPEDRNSERCPACERWLTEWKESAAAALLASTARARGVRLHGGRGNTRRRLRWFHWIGCDTADGTTLAHGPDRNLAPLIAWMRELNHPTLWEAS
jgi:hypothetical protein